MKIIINADDLGYSANVNKAIFQLMGAGRVTSSTLLVAGAAFGEAANESSLFKDCSFGVHLALTEMTAMTSPALFQDVRLIDDTGHFGKTEIFRLRPSASLIECVYKEWCAQVEKALDYCVPCSHLDSHHNAHTIWWLLPALSRLMCRYRIRKVRKSMNWESKQNTLVRTALIPAKQAAWNSALRVVCRAKMTDCFTDFRRFVSRNRCDYGEGLSAEVMVHPGGDTFLDETRLLEGPTFDEIVRCHELISYLCL